jgi:hypothetical protein
MAAAEEHEQAATGRVRGDGTMEGMASIGWVSDGPAETPTTRLRDELRKAESVHPLSKSARIETFVADKVCKALLAEPTLRKALASGRVNKPGLVKTLTKAIVPGALRQAGVPEPASGDGRDVWASLRARMQDDIAALGGK